jgi:hypothetical protein
MLRSTASQLTLAESIGRALDGRKCGSQWVARCPAHEDRSPSLSITERNGKVLVCCHAGCSQTDVIAALRARGLWPAAETKTVLTPQEKQDWIRRRHQTDTHLADAERWRRAAVLMVEELLVPLKTALFDPTAGPADPDAVEWHEVYLSYLRRLSGEWLVTEYLVWRRDHPWLTAGMEGSVRDRDLAAEAALEQLWQALEEAK